VDLFLIKPSPGTESRFNCPYGLGWHRILEWWPDRMTKAATLWVSLPPRTSPGDIYPGSFTLPAQIPVVNLRKGPGDVAWVR